jgi:mono/diheme cytochrome c family protein
MEPGSRSSDRVARIEVYLDDRPEAVQVLTAPPFRFQLDTSGLDEGAHSLRLVRFTAAGTRQERRIPFQGANDSGMQVKGLEPGATVTGNVDVDVVVPEAAPAPASAVRPKGPPMWLYLLATVLILGGIWVFFMVVPIYSNLVPAGSEGGSASTSGPTAPAPPVDATLLKAGDKLYTSDCASCHKPSGEGMPPTFPALAGNSVLGNTTAVVKTIYDGNGAMPSHPTYSATMLAEVATYIRNTWGNAYGGVSVADAAKAAPAASNEGSSGAASAPASGSASTPASSESSSASSSSAATSTSAASGSDAAMQAGEQIYESDCASCHQPNGAGLPPTFPALAGNNVLQDASVVVKTIVDGKGVMPPHPSYTTKQLSDVATFVRNSWGNSFGPVSVEQAAQAAPKAAP